MPLVWWRGFLSIAGRMPDAFSQPAVRVAIVGTGRVARYHAAAVAALPGAELVAAVDHTPERARAFLDEHGFAGVPVRETVAEMLGRDRPNLVCVCTPPGAHFEVAAAALRGGAWAYVEKPLCESLRQIDGLVEIERETGNKVAGVVQWRAGGGARAAADIVASGALGPLRAAVANTLWFRGDDYFAVPWRGRWATEAGGTTVSHAIHTLDLMLALAGDWREVRALAATVARRVETEDAAAAAVRFECGGVGSVMNSCLSPRQKSYLRLDFDRASVELRHFTFYRDADWTFTPAPGHEALAERWAEALARHADAPPTQQTQLADVLAAMRDNRDPPTNLASVRRGIEFVTALYKSAHTARPVLRGEVIEGDPYYDHVGGPLALRGATT